MALYRSKGIVLRSIRYGEADRILDLYTLDSGLVSGIAKGIRRTKSRFGGRLEPLSCVDFIAYHGRTLDTITQVEVLKSFHGVREDLRRFEVAGELVKVVRAFSGGDEADRRVFNLLYRSLEALEESRLGLRGDRDCVRAQALHARRLRSAARRLPVLRNALPAEKGRFFYAPGPGGLLCEDCRPASPDSFPLPPGAVDRLQTLIENPMREADEHRLDGVAGRVVRSHVLAHAPGVTRSAPEPEPEPG